MKNDHDQITSKVHKFLDDNIRYIQYPCYAAGMIGLAIIAKSIYMFSRFTTAASIPQEFVSKGIKLRGRVLKIATIENQTASVNFHPVRLHLEHIPITTFKLKKEEQKSNRLDDALNLQIAGIEANPDGIKEIHKLIPLNSAIWFKLFGADVENNIIFASIFLESTWRNLWRSQDLAVVLLKQKKATVSSFKQQPPVVYNSNYSKYYRNLLFCESKARREKKFPWLRNLW